MSGQPAAAQAQYTEVYEACYGDVLRYCRRRLDEESARDATAETFAVAWRRWSEIPRPPLPWLYGVARRVLANADRADRRRTRLVERIVDGYSTPGAACDSDAGTDVALAFASLSDQDQEILRLSAWEELSPSEIGQVLGCRPGTASVRLHRARRRLRTALEGKPPQESVDPLDPAGEKSR